MNWVYYRRTRNCAALSVTAAYVIVHRPGEHTLGYRLSRAGGYLGVYETWQAARAAAVKHAIDVAKGLRHGAATPAKTV